MTVQPAANPPPTTWKVVRQVEANKPGPTGRYQPGMTVTFTTGKGVTGSVWVAEAVYSKTTVRQLVAQKAAVLDAVQSLTG